jgi:tripartite-type tricarboxylate transporter receptor subunit TctC
MLKTILKKNLLRQCLALVALVASGLSVTPTLAQVQNYPDRPVKWLVPYGPGGGTDIVARIVTQNMSVNLKQPFIVENRGGGNTIIATQALSKLQSDGYSAMQTADQLAANTSLYKELPYVANQDFEFVSSLVKTPLVLLARNELPVNSMKELVAYIQKNENKMSYGSWGTGSMNHLTMEALAGQLKASPLHVPYAGAPLAINALLGGFIDLLFTDLGSALPQVQAGKLKPLAVSTATRITQLPELPTIAESGFPGFDLYSYQGVILPKGTPAELVAKLSAAIKVALDNPTIASDLNSRGYIPSPSTPAQFKAQFIKSEKDLGDIIRSRNITLDK